MNPTVWMEEIDKEFAHYTQTHKRLARGWSEGKGISYICLHGGIWHFGKVLPMSMEILGKTSQDPIVSWTWTSWYFSNATGPTVSSAVRSDLCIHLALLQGLYPLCKTPKENQIINYKKKKKKNIWFILAFLGSPPWRSLLCVKLKLSRPKSQRMMSPTFLESPPSGSSPCICKTPKTIKSVGTTVGDEMNIVIL